MNQTSTSQAIHRVNNQLMLVMALADLLNKRLSSSAVDNTEAIKLVNRIREAASDAATATMSIQD